MDTKLNRLNQELKFFDKDLLAKRESDGRINIYRKRVRFETYDCGRFKLRVTKVEPLYILALTDNWTPKGKTVDVGIEPVMAKLREMDCWNRVRFYEEFKSERDRQEESVARERRGLMEDVASDLRKPFSKAFDTYSVSSTINKGK